PRRSQASSVADDEPDEVRCQHRRHAGTRLAERADHADDLQRAVRAVDPRLLRQAGSARGYLAVTVGLGVVVAGRAVAAAGGEAAALRAAAAVKSGLRRRLSGHVLRLGPQWLGGQPRAEITTLATRGLDGLDPYFARYLPRLVLGVTVPLAV